MNSRLLLVLIVIPILFSCLPKKPEIPLAEVAAGPLLDALEHQRKSFSSLKAVATLEVVKRGRKRTFENVGIVLDGLRRLRLEAFGPMGQSELALVWDGAEVLLRLPGSDRVIKDGKEQLERLLGEDLDVRELGMIFSGNIPEQTVPQVARLGCTRHNECTLTLPQGILERRIKVRFLQARLENAPRIVSHELFRSGELYYRVEYDRTEEISSYPLPMHIEISNPGRNVSLTIVYGDADVNVPISDGMFTLPDGGSGNDR